MTTVELEIGAEMLRKIGEHAEELEISRADLIRDMLSYALENIHEIYDIEDSVENLEDENGNSEEE
jgi:hypothetical protein